MSSAYDKFDVQINLNDVHYDLPKHGNPEQKLWLVFPCADKKAVVKGSLFESTYEPKMLTALHKAGYSEKDMFVTTICREPKGSYNEAANYRLKDDEVTRFISLVHKHQPKLVMLVGEASLVAITGNTGIDKWRGSLYEEESLGTHVLPLYNGKRMCEEEELTYLTQIDFGKAQKFMAGWVKPEKNYIINPRFDEVIAYLEILLHDTEIFSCDIETQNDHVSCIGFSDRVNDAFVIPFISKHSNDGNHWTHSQEVQIVDLLSKVMNNPKSAKVFQNGMFDMTVLYERMRIFTRGPILDTMVHHHLIYPDLKQNLGLLVSLYTMNPYHKGEGQAWKNPLITDEQFWTYNAKDADTTLECWYAIVEQAKKFGYYRKMQELIDLQPEVWKMSLRGLNVDLARKAELAAEADEEVKKYDAQLSEILGHPINLDSPKQVSTAFYGELCLPVQLDRKTKRVSTGKQAITDLKAYLLNQKESELRDKKLLFLNTLLKRKEIAKLASTYYHCPISEDGRHRSTFGMGGRQSEGNEDNISGSPDTGRFSSGKYFDGAGGNQQNFPKKAKQYIIPDDPDTELLVNADLGQADARVVAYDSGDPGLIALFESGVDYHSANAKNVFGYDDIADVSPEHRQLTKRGGHAANYLISAASLAVSLGVSFKVADDFLKSYFGTYPGLKMWQANIEAKIKRDRTLITPMGRRRTYLCRIDNPCIYSATAFIPQSTVSDRLNRSIMSFLAVWPSARWLLQCHDSVLFSVKKTEVDRFVATLKHHLEQPITTQGGRTFVIPADFEIGRNYKDMVRYLSPTEHGSVRLLLEVGKSVKEVVAELKVNKDAVQALAEGNNWREW